MYIDPICLATLPAIHALSGCDTTSKVGMKLVFLKKPLDLSLMEEFGTDTLSEDTIQKADFFDFNYSAPKFCHNF